MREKNISENKLPKKAVLFELIKTEYPEIDGIYKANFESQKYSVDLALQSKFSDKERLDLLDELRRGLSVQIHHFLYNVFYQIGDIEIEVKKDMVLNDILDNLPEPFISLTKNARKITETDSRFKANPNTSETLLKAYDQKDTKLTELNVTPLEIVDSFVNSNMPEAIRQPFESLRENFDKDSNQITVDEQIDTFTALLSKLYYQRELFKYICHLHDDLKYKMENGNTEKMNESKLHWGKSKADLIRLLIALHDLKAIKSEDDTALNQQQIMDKFGAFLNVDLSDIDQNLSNALERDEKVNTKFFESMATKIKKRCEKRLNEGGKK